MIMGMLPNAATIEITAEILALVSEIDEFKGAWRALGALAPDRLAALRRVATIESVGSSTRIEGSKLSDAEVERLLSKLDITSFASRDEQEVAGYAQVMATVFAHHDDIPLTENHITQLHRDLLAYSTKDARHRGAYKTLPNNVSAFDLTGREIGVVFETASPFDTPRRMAELVEWTSSMLKNGTLHPLLVITVFNVVFLEIHPFQDGNGRLSRILSTMLLLRAGYAHVAYSSLENVIEHNKEGYYLGLRQTQKTIHGGQPDWQPWIIFFLRSMQLQKRRLEQTIERERIIVNALPELSLKILDITKERERTTIAELVAITGANRNTVKKHLSALVASRHLVQHGIRKGTWYRVLVK
jgi:Fic family protein